MEKEGNKKKIGITVILILLILAMLGMGIYLFFFSEAEDYERQDIEEGLADQYEEDLLDMYVDADLDELQAKLEVEEQEKGDLGQISLPGVNDIVDDEWYERDGTVYTPEYAKGELECVLRVPAAGINRGVYTGTWEDINYNLDIWMVTVARPDYVLGETHYVIYGHNYTRMNKTVSFNKLKDVVIGDTFTLMTDRDVYKYEVTDSYWEVRSKCTTTVVDNFDLPNDKCYILTCASEDGSGRDPYGKDIVVEGTLIEKVTIIDYVKEQYSKIDTTFDLSLEEDGSILVTSMRPSDVVNEGSTIQLIDVEGNVIEEFLQTGEAFRIGGIPSGRYTLKTVSQAKGVYFGLGEVEFDYENGKLEVEENNIPETEGKQEVEKESVDLITIGALVVCGFAVVVLSIGLVLVWKGRKNKE